MFIVKIKQMPKLFVGYSVEWSEQASVDLNSRPGFATDYLSDPWQVP